MVAADLLADADSLRLGVFLGLLAAFALWETAAPARRSEVPRLVRWTNNLALVAVDALVLRLFLPVLALGAAFWAGSRGIGLLPLLGITAPVAFVLTLLVLDLTLWVQHIVFHKVPALWRLHRMHHADPHVDATTGLRFHPAEVLLSMALKIAVVVALGAPPLAVLAFELLLNAASIFNHANIGLSPRAERIVGRLLVTPAMHRVHHSQLREETDSNYGFSVPWWDHLFGTYKGRVAHAPPGIGAFASARDQWLDRLLVQPFRRR